jgi:hypothetical protein
MSETPEDPLASLANRPWRPRSLEPARKDSLRLRWRLSILITVVLLHMLGVRVLLELLSKGDSNDEVITVLNFIEPLLPPPPLPPLPAQIPPVPTRKPLAKPTAVSSQTPQQPTPAKTHHPENAPLQLYDPDGSLSVPDDMLDQIDRKVGDKRIFSYQIPRIDDAKKIFYRNPPVVYETTRFAQYWKPDQDMLTELLTKMVEATTKEIRIPVPGRPGSTMVCTVSILAFGGGCGVLTNGSDYVGPLDDPNTLSPEEDRQCQAWWEQIIGAKTQELWRKTRALYEAQCRKPLERRK